jgi:hypothetical protein
MCAKFSPARVKAQGDGGGGRILLGDGAGHGAFMLRPIRSAVLEFRWLYPIPTWAQLDLRRALRKITMASVGECLWRATDSPGSVFFVDYPEDDAITTAHNSVASQKTAIFSYLSVGRPVLLLWRCHPRSLQFSTEASRCVFLYLKNVCNLSI